MARFKRCTLYVFLSLTHTSLESIDRAPVSWQSKPIRQFTSCLKYSPCQRVSWTAIMMRYTPISKSATARFVKRNDCILLSLLYIHLQRMTERLPTNAKRPRSQTQTLTAELFIMSSQLENSFLGESHVKSLVALFA